MLAAIEIMGFEEASYTVNESGGQLEACVVLLVEVQRTVELILFTSESGLAEGKSVRAVCCALFIFKIDYIIPITVYKLDF